MKHAKLITLGLFATSVLFTGCTAPAKTAEKENPKAVKQEAQQEQSRQYSSTGSWIPRKIKKKEDVIGTNTQTASGEALQKAQMQGTSHTTSEPPGR